MMIKKEQEVREIPTNIFSESLCKFFFKAMNQDLNKHDEQNA